MSVSIDSYASQLSDLYNKTNSADSKKLDGSLSKDYSNATDEELMDVCKQFEAYFLEQVIKRMELMIPKSEDEDSSTSQMVDYFKDTMIQEIAAESTESQGLGIAQQLFESMKREYKI